MLERLLTDDSLQALLFLCLPLTVLLIILIVALVRGWHVPTPVSLPISSTVARLGDFFSRGDSLAIDNQRAGRNPAQSSSGGVRKLLPFFALIVLPYLLIQFSGFPQWLSRPVVLAVLICSGGCYLCYWSFNPNSRILGARAKLSNPEYDQSRGQIILGIRGFSFAFSLALIGYFGLPFAAISLRLAKGERPVPVSGTVLRNDSYRAAFFLGQRVTLSTKYGGLAEYHLFYSPRVLRYGQDYTLIVMQGSNLVLDITTR
jgi:hypothetical protein